LQDALEGVGVCLAGKREEVSVTGVGECVFDTERAVAAREPATVLRAAACEVGEGGVRTGVGESEKGFGERTYGDGKVGIGALMGDDLAAGEVEYKPGEARVDSWWPAAGQGGLGGLGMQRGRGCD
jgi:hypothetical protein